MEDRPAQVAVISPHPVVVEGLTAMLRRHPDRVEVVEIPPTFDSLEPDIVLYDVVALLEGHEDELAKLVNGTAAVVLAVNRELRPDLLGRALSRGVDGFFGLGVTEDELLAAIASATTRWRSGDAGPDPVVGSSTSEQRSRRLGHDVGLSPRETRVLSLVAQGLSNDEIAARDFLSINTVKTYIRTAYRKIGVTSRSQASVWAVQHGYATEIDASIFYESEDPEPDPD